jgi:hypothetical protein
MVYLVTIFVALIIAAGYAVWQRYLSATDDYEDDEELGRVKIRHGNL